MAAFIHIKETLCQVSLHFWALRCESPVPLCLGLSVESWDIRRFDQCCFRFGGKDGERGARQLIQGPTKQYAKNYKKHNAISVDMRSQFYDDLIKHKNI